jgi:ABC-2 type transport system permease protein
MVSISQLVLTLLMSTLQSRRFRDLSILLLTLVPVVLGIGLPYVLGQPLIWLASVPLSLVYGIAFYVILTNFSARHLLAREPEILAITTRE